MQRYFEQAAGQQPMCDRERRAAYAISACGTRALGAHVLRCPDGAVEQLQFHACRHRTCVRCGAAAQPKWADAQLARLLPCAHHHVIFTLPHELLALWSHNRGDFAELMMRSTRQCLLQVLADERHLGALPGIMQSLHTWGRNLSRHPHVHCLVSAGGIDALGQWRRTREHWLAPVAVLRAHYKRGLLQGIGHGLRRGWSLPAGTDAAHWQSVLKRLWRTQHWNLEICPPYEHGQGVVLYLARYAKSGPLPRTRPLELDDDGCVRFSYQDHRERRTKTLRLPAWAFVRRLLWHVPVPGQHTTRHSGLYNSHHRRQHAHACEHLQQQQRPWHRPRAQPKPPPATLCPHCGQAMLRTHRLQGLATAASRRHHDGAISPLAATDRAGRGPTWRSNGPPAANRGRAPPSSSIVGSARPLPSADGRSPLR